MSATSKLPKKRGIQGHGKEKQLNKTERTFKQNGENLQTKNVRPQTPVLKFKKQSNNTTISILKDKNITPNITWKVMKFPLANKISRRCLFCLHEKVAIITHPSKYTLLKYKSEIISKCRHENKPLLSQFDSNT